MEYRSFSLSVFVVLSLMLTAGCIPAEDDKDRSAPDPAVGRTHDPNGAETDSTNVEASHPIRNIESDTTTR